MKLLSCLCLVLGFVQGMAFLGPSQFLPSQSLTRPAAKGASNMNMVVKIVLGEGESVESAIQRFKRAVNRSGHLQELRHRRQFETTQERKKRKMTQARKRARIMRQKMRGREQF